MNSPLRGPWHFSQLGRAYLHKLEGNKIIITFIIILIKNNNKIIISFFQLYPFSTADTLTMAILVDELTSELTAALDTLKAINFNINFKLK